MLMLCIIPLLEVNAAVCFKTSSDRGGEEEYLVESKGVT